MDTKLLKILKEQIDKIEALKNEECWGPKYKIWESTTTKLVNDLFGAEYLSLFKSTSSVGGFSFNQNQNQIAYMKILEEVKELLNGFIEERERLGNDSALSIGSSVNSNDYVLHQRIKEVVGLKYENGHYAESVESAFKEVIKRVKDFVNSKTSGGFDGEKAMNRAFGFENQEPLIKFNSLQSTEEKDEQRGIMNLFKGIVGIRNRKAHENITLKDPNRALEYLSLASLLMRLLDDYENY